MRTAPEAVTLAHLRLHGSLAGLVEVAPGEPGRVVKQVVLAGSLERLRALPPDTLIILTGDAAAGAWALAGAMRIGWERRAAGLVAPAETCGPAAGPLAMRLDMALLAHDSDMFDVALNLALEVGNPAVLRDRRVARVAASMADQKAAAGIVRALRDHLDVPVALTAAGQLIAGDASVIAAENRTESVTVAVAGPDGAPWAQLRASMTVGADASSSEVESIFKLARAPLAAALARTRLSSARRLQRGQLELRRLRETTAAPGFTSPTEEHQPPTARANHAIEASVWPSNGNVVGIYLTELNRRDEAPTLDLTTMLAEEWSARVANAPLVIDRDGWASWFEVSSDDAVSDVAKRLRSRFAAEARTWGIAIGVGPRLEAPDGLLRSIDRARLAARAASPGTVERFDKLGVTTVLASLRGDELRTIGAVALPDLFSAKDADVLIRTLATVLDYGGSLHRAAEVLGVHRNTVLARVTKARDLGADIDDARTRLALHSLCYAVLQQ